MVVEMWECQWKEYKRHNTIHNAYLYPPEHTFRMTEQKILVNVLSGRMFGAMEVDIEVP